LQHLRPRDAQLYDLGADRNLEILRRLWTEEPVNAEYPPHLLRGANLSPKPLRPPPILTGGHVDRVLKRAALNGGWLTYFYTPEGFAQSWSKVQAYAKRAGRIRRRCSTPINRRLMSALRATRSQAR
jgi:alkanesulfonate monooxygenase SsuD/methylene tetrahydromethanopterin reductase-like flavin-dependent oxidoreductase (luciferase family)